MIGRKNISMDEGLRAESAALASRMGLNLSIVSELLLRSMLLSYSLPSPFVPADVFEKAVREGRAPKRKVGSKQVMLLDEDVVAAARSAFATVELGFSAGMSILLSSLVGHGGFPYQSMPLTQAMEARGFEPGSPHYVYADEVSPFPDSPDGGRSAVEIW